MLLLPLNNSCSPCPLPPPQPPLISVFFFFAGACRICRSFTQATEKAAILFYFGFDFDEGLKKPLACCKGTPCDPRPAALIQQRPSSATPHQMLRQITRLLARFAPRAGCGRCGDRGQASRCRRRNTIPLARHRKIAVEIYLPSANTRRMSCCSREKSTGSFGLRFLKPSA